MELGSLLKKARQEKGLSLDDIQEKTKIRKKYLEAIEENNFDLLPGKVYLKVFIKGYAREVDLNYQELLKNFEVLNIQEKKESNLQKDYLGGTKVSSRSRKKKKGNLFKIIFVILLVLFLGAAVVYTYQYVSNAEIRLLNQSTTQEESIEEESEVLEVNEDEQTDDSEKDSTDRSESSGDSESENSSSKSNFNLDLTDNYEQDQGFDLKDAFDSAVLNEENTEIIDQNNFNGLDGPNSEEQTEINEIIVSDEDNNQLNNEDSTASNIE
ncbi:MAG: helix-turn-helix domain-containing protein, partial [Halanaerobium sp.]